jgi:hypothetical protein
LGIEKLSSVPPLVAPNKAINRTPLRGAGYLGSLGEHPVIDPFLQVLDELLHSVQV